LFYFGQNNFNSFFSFSFVSVSLFIPQEFRFSHRISPYLLEFLIQTLYRKTHNSELELVAVVNLKKSPQAAHAAGTGNKNKVY